MKDTERLNLIDHYKWTVVFINGGCYIVLHEARTYSFAKTLREAIDGALAAQIKWALG